MTVLVKKHKRKETSTKSLYDSELFGNNLAWSRCSNIYFLIIGTKLVTTCANVTSARKSQAIPKLQQSFSDRQTPEFSECNAIQAIVKT